ncbi:nucleotidyltransferase family protein [Kineosporia babensis]|uniref:NTP transferase domain-containing protein n=1 Tax=Kineosporia babensis TaxID=499548 RepID=A0A9X1N976_9ACTN|nr:sugar phosphate nucleotidyltransferase [Kineosporia babensis]MCD5310717.1 NTP transferase domain-containing protein [Kineosporia babensis]
MHAVILAGGQGVRLRPYTTSLPKPLMPIGDRYSILEIVLTQLSDQGFTDVTLAIGHLGHLIRSFIGDGSRWGLQVRYLDEDRPMGTMGPVLRLIDELPSEVLVMNGDILTDMNYAQLLTDHRAGGHPLTIATYQREVKIDFGVLEIDSDQVVAFREKPTHHYRVSMGVYGVSTAALRGYDAGRHFGFDDLVLDLLKQQTPPGSFPFEGFWLDIGRPDDYDQANHEFGTLAPTLLPKSGRHVAGECPPVSVSYPITSWNPAPLTAPMNAAPLTEASLSAAEPEPTAL